MNSILTISVSGLLAEPTPEAPTSPRPDQVPTKLVVIDLLPPQPDSCPDASAVRVEPSALSVNVAEL